jgi:hypothetical protein
MPEQDQASKAQSRWGKNDMTIRNRIADFLISLGFWLDGSGWNYDEFHAGYKAGMKAAKEGSQNG